MTFYLHMFPIQIKIHNQIQYSFLPYFNNMYHTYCIPTDAMNALASFL